jgi:hypothetical protein
MGQVTNASEADLGVGLDFADTEVLEAEEAALAPNEYHFVNTWRLRGDIETIAQIISDPKGYQHWWPCAWLDYEGVQHGGEQEIGGVFRYRVKGWMPYTLNLTFTVRDVQRPHGFTVEAAGDLKGTGTWTLVQDGPVAVVTYAWRVQAERAFIRSLSGVLKPLFRSNHFWVMRNGARSLALELARRRASTPAELSRIPPPPGPTFPHNLRRRRERSVPSSAGEPPETLS